jgi:hypothetical protein
MEKIYAIHVMEQEKLDLKQHYVGRVKVMGKKDVTN